MLRRESKRVTNVRNTLPEGTGGKCWPKSIWKWTASVRLQVSVLHTDTDSSWQLVSMGMQVNNSEPATHAHWGWTRELIHGRDGIKTLPVLSEGGYRLARGWSQNYPCGAGLETETSGNTFTLTQVQMQPVEIVEVRVYAGWFTCRSPLAVSAEKDSGSNTSSEHTWYPGLGF